MKIHIVQKGDTLWKIAKKYGVDFEELKKMNSQLSNPDMIMPGMKIKVPTSGGNIKKEAPIAGSGAKINMGAKKEMPKKEQPIQPVKEQPIHQIKEQPIQPIKEKPIKEMPVAPVKEQPVEIPKEQPQMPYMPQMPMPMVPEVDINNYFMMNMANIKAMEQTAPQLPPQPKEVPVKEVPVKEAPIKEVPINEAPIKEVPINEAPIQQQMPDCFPMYNPCFDPCLPMYNPCFDPCYPGYPQVHGSHMPQAQPFAYPQVQGAYMSQAPYMPCSPVQGTFMPQAQPFMNPQVQGAYMPQAPSMPYSPVQGSYMPQAQPFMSPQVQGAFMPEAQPLGNQGGLGASMPNPSMPVNPHSMPGVEGNFDMFDESSPLMPPMVQGQSVGEGSNPNSFYSEPFTQEFSQYGNAGLQAPMGVGESNPYMPQMMQGQMPTMGYQPTTLPAHGYQPSMLQENDCGCGGPQAPQAFGAYGMPSGFAPSPMQFGPMRHSGFIPGAYPPPVTMWQGQQGFVPQPMVGNDYQQNFNSGNLFQRNDDESSEFNG